MAIPLRGQDFCVVLISAKELTREQRAGSIGENPEQPADNPARVPQLEE
jgi:hypothetical protein